jgi:hypothetical protein
MRLNDMLTDPALRASGPLGGFFRIFATQALNQAVAQSDHQNSGQTDVPF